MVDSELLILCVEKFPCIWNSMLHEYHNKNIKDASWNSVCKHLFEEWSTLSPKVKEEKQKDLKKKWHSIREYFKKGLSIQRAVKTGKPAKKRKRYVYADILEFLKPVFERRETSSNFDTVQLQQDYDSSDQTSSVEQIPSPASTKSQTIPSSTTKKNTVKLKQFESIIIATLEKRASQQDKDPDLLFFKSLLPDMKKLTDAQKIDFKLGMIKLYKDITNPTPQLASVNQTYFTQFQNRSMKSNNSSHSHSPSNDESPEDQQFDYIQ